MRGEFKNDTPVPAKETKYKFELDKEEEELLMTKFEEACQEPSEIVSQVRHDLYRSLIIKFFQEKLRVELGKLLDEKKEKWKTDNEWVKKCKKCKILKSELYLVSNIEEKAQDKDKLKGYKISTVDVSIDEEEFDFVEKSFKEAKLPLTYVSGIDKKDYSQVEFGKSFIEIEFTYTL